MIWRALTQCVALALCIGCCLSAQPVCHSSEKDANCVCTPVDPSVVAMLQMNEGNFIDENINPMNMISKGVKAVKQMATNVANAVNSDDDGSEPDTRSRMKKLMELPERHHMKPASLQKINRKVPAAVVARMKEEKDGLEDRVNELEAQLEKKVAPVHFLNSQNASGRTEVSSDARASVHTKASGDTMMSQIVNDPDVIEAARQLQVNLDNEPDIYRAAVKAKQIKELRRNQDPALSQDGAAGPEQAPLHADSAAKAHEPVVANDVDIELPGHHYWPVLRGFFLMPDVLFPAPLPTVVRSIEQAQRICRDMASCKGFTYKGGMNSKDGAVIDFAWGCRISNCSCDHWTWTTHISRDRCEQPVAVTANPDGSIAEQNFRPDSQNLPGQATQIAEMQNYATGVVHQYEEHPESVPMLDAEEEDARAERVKQRVLAEGVVPADIKIPENRPKAEYPANADDTYSPTREVGSPDVNLAAVRSSKSAPWLLSKGHRKNPTEIFKQKRKMKVPTQLVCGYDAHGDELKPW